MNFELFTDEFENKTYSDIEITNADGTTKKVRIRKGLALVNSKLPAGWPKSYINLDWRKNLSLTRFKSNPVLTADHVNSVDNVIGRVSKIDKAEKGLQVELDFAEDDERAQRIANLWDRNYLKGLSITYSIQDYEFQFDEKSRESIFDIKKAELSYLAVVPVPRDAKSLKNSLESSAFVDFDKFVTRNNELTIGESSLDEGIQNLLGKLSGLTFISKGD